MDTELRRMMSNPGVFVAQWDGEQLFHDGQPATISPALGQHLHGEQPHVVLGPQGWLKTMDTPCPFCRAAQGDPCVTESGRPARETHCKRIDEAMWIYRTQFHLVMTNSDDEHIGVRAGDLFVALRYPSDAKWTLVARIGDNADLECNQYSHDCQAVSTLIPRARDDARISTVLRLRGRTMDELLEAGLTVSSDAFELADCERIVANR